MKSFFVILVIVGLAACAPATATSSLPASNLNASVRPLADILGSGPEFVGDSIDNLTAKLGTKIPVACAVVYGESTAYGNIATDADMRGGHIRIIIRF